MARRASVLISWVVAALAALAVIAAVAFAGMPLPIFSGNAARATLSSAATRFVAMGGAIISCTTDSATITFNAGTRRLGPGTFTYNTCTQGGEQCRSLGDPLGTILTTGEWHLVLMERGGVDGHYFVVLLPAQRLHVECPTAAVKLDLISGAVEGPIGQRPGSKTEFGISIKDKEGKEGPQEFSEFENEAGTGVTLSLKVSQEGGALKEESINDEEEIMTFEEPTSIEN
jgi:hypothetical protein